MKTATPKDTWDHTIGSGALTFSWWAGMNDTDEWPAILRIDDPDDEDNSVSAEVSHADVMRAARKIASGQVSANESIRRECRNLLVDPDDADLDAVAGDCVLQLAVLGDIVYG